MIHDQRVGIEQALFCRLLLDTLTGARTLENLKDLNLPATGIFIILVLKYTFDFIKSRNGGSPENLVKRITEALQRQTEILSKLEAQGERNMEKTIEQTACLGSIKSSLQSHADETRGAVVKINEQFTKIEVALANHK